MIKCSVIPQQYVLTGVDACSFDWSRYVSFPLDKITRSNPKILRPASPTVFHSFFSSTTIFPTSSTPLMYSSRYLPPISAEGICFSPNVPSRPRNLEFVPVSDASQSQNARGYYVDPQENTQESQEISVLPTSSSVSSLALLWPVI